MPFHLPLPIARYLRTVDLGGRVYAFVGLNKSNAVKYLGGELAHFGLESVQKNELILEKYGFLEGNMRLSLFTMHNLTKTSLSMYIYLPTSKDSGYYLWITPKMRFLINWSSRKGSM